MAAFVPLGAPGVVAVILTLWAHRQAAQGESSTALDVTALTIASIAVAINVTVVFPGEGGGAMAVMTGLLAAVGVALERRRTRSRSLVPPPPPPAPPAPPPAGRPTSAAPPVPTPAPHTRPRLPSRPKPHAPAGGKGLRGLTDGARLVVVDTETTGLYNRDRVLEVATIELDGDGHVVDQWETLLAAGRDVGPTYIHRITPDMLLDAPMFATIAGELASRLDGAVLVGHNVGFDIRMLANEFERAGIAFDPGTPIDTRAAVGGSLDAACERLGVDLNGHHRALVDAMATAQLLVAVADDCVAGRPASLEGSVPASARALTREQVAATNGVSAAPPAVASGGADAYHELVEHCLVDLHLTADQRAELDQLAGHLGLSAAQRHATHHNYIEALLHGALERHTISEDDYDQLLRCAHALDVEADLVERRTRRLRTATATVELTEGLIVCFTGEDPAHSRGDTLSHARSLGLVVAKDVTKKTDLVVANHPDSASTKAERARLYDLPIASVANFMAAAPGGLLAVTVLSVPQRKVVTCPDCLGTATVPGRTRAGSSRRCVGCRT